jgi:RND superfamily putative drug exporter
MLARLAHVIARRPWTVIGIWIVLTLIGGFASGKINWFKSFTNPSSQSYKADQRITKATGTGQQPPVVLVFHEAGDVTKDAAIGAAIDRAMKENTGARVSSFASTQSLAYVSADRHTTFANIYPPGPAGFGAKTTTKATRVAIAKGLPARITAHVTGQGPLIEDDANGSSGGPSIFVEALIGGLGALVILFFVFGTLPAVLMPLIVAVVAIMNTFGVVWLLTQVTSVSQVVQFLIALVGLGVAIDYALLMIFRFRDELREGEDVETALVETMTHAGRSVIVSGSTVAVGLLSMIVLPVPFLRSIGIGGMLIPAVSVLTAITLLPAMLSLLGARINSVRLLPKRLLDKGHPEDGAWGRWARFVNRRPWPTALVGLVVVGLLVSAGLQLSPGEAQMKNIPSKADAAAGRTALADAAITPDVMLPLVVDVENGADPNRVVDTLQGIPGIVGAVAPQAWRASGTSVVEAFANVDGESKGIRPIISRVKAALGPDATLGGPAAGDRDFVKAIFGNFPYVLAFVVVLTFILLARAFRSFVLPLKAVVLNLVSLAGAFGIVVLIFQEGHGSSLWNVTATQSIPAWIPLMIFAFLFGLSMDYEVFMLSRIREAYDESGSTEKAIELGIARTGKLVTSAALILMFAFLVLSSGPGFEIKEFAIGLAAGVIFDATVIRALLVPALMRLLGDANWWLPGWAAKVLRVEKQELPPPAVEPA